MLTSFGCRTNGFRLLQPQCVGSNSIPMTGMHILPRRRGYLQNLILLVLLTGPAQTAWAATLRITPTVSVTENYTDNVLAVRENAEADWLTQARAGAAFTANGNRLNLNLSLNAVQDYYLDTDGLNSLRPQALGRGEVELLEDHFFVDGSVSLSETSTSRGGARSALDRTLGSNQTQLLLYEVSPRFVNQFGRMLEATLEYTHSESRYSDPAKGVSDPLPVSTGLSPPLRSFDSISGRDQKSDDLSLKLDTGRYFSRLNSKLTLLTSTTKSDAGNRAAATGQAGSRKLSEDRIDLVNEYQLTRQFALIGRAGYEDVQNRNPNTAAKDSSLSNSGPTGAVGFHWLPGPRLDLRSEYGRKYGEKNFSADLSYKLSSFYYLNASFSQSVRTQTRSRLDQLNRLIEGPDGRLIDPFTGIERDPAFSNFDLSNNAFREDLFQLGLTGIRGRNTYNLGADFSSRESQNNTVKEEQLDINLDYTRRLQPRLYGVLGVSYSDQLNGGNTNAVNNQLSNGDEEFQGNASLNYRLGPSLNTNFRYVYMKRKFDNAGAISENALSASIEASF